MEINAQFLDRIGFAQSVFEYARVDAKLYLNGPITIPIACSDVVRAKASEMGIETTGAGIVFIIEKLDDFLVAMEQFRSLFYTTSDIASRVPDNLAGSIPVSDSLEYEPPKEGPGKITSWLKGLVGRFKTT
jgi:hypothetical protein